LSNTALIKKQNAKASDNLKLLNAVPFESGFHFFIEHGKYTGITAISTVEFAEKLQLVPIQAVLYHFRRQDFQNWLRNTIGDEELASRISQIKVSKDEELQKRLFEEVNKRISELQIHP
jgi:Family of unknown function (DUF5752)